MRIIRELIDFQPQESTTNVAEALRYLTNAIKKKCTAFLISDFVNSNAEQALPIAANKHDLVALHILDHNDANLPNLGMLQIVDPETGAITLVDSSNSNVRKQYQKWWIDEYQKNEALFKKTGVDFAKIYTGKDYVKPLTELFQKRGA